MATHLALDAGVGEVQLLANALPATQGQVPVAGPAALQAASKLNGKHALIEDGSLNLDHAFRE